MQLIFFDEAKDDKDYAVYHIGDVCIDEEDLVPRQHQIHTTIRVCAAELQNPDAFLSECLAHQCFKQLLGHVVQQAQS